MGVKNKYFWKTIFFFFLFIQSVFVVSAQEITLNTKITRKIVSYGALGEEFSQDFLYAELLWSRNNNTYTLEITFYKKDGSIEKLTLKNGNLVLKPSAIDGNKRTGMIWGSLEQNRGAVYSMNRFFWVYNPDGEIIGSDRISIPSQGESSLHFEIFAFKTGDTLWFDAYGAIVFDGSMFHD